MIGAADTAIKTNECLACAKTATFFCFHMLGLTGLDSELVGLPVVYSYLESHLTPSPVGTAAAAPLGSDSSATTPRTAAAAQRPAEGLGVANNHTR